MAIESGCSWPLRSSATSGDHGAGTISMTVTNALGQQVTLTQPFYASAAMLAPRLQTFAVQIRFGSASTGAQSATTTGRSQATAIYRRGLTSEVHDRRQRWKARPAHSLAGVGGGVIQIGNLGVVSTSPAAISNGRRTVIQAYQTSIGAQRISRIFSLGASAKLLPAKTSPGHRSAQRRSPVLRKDTAQRQYRSFDEALRHDRGRLWRAQPADPSRRLSPTRGSDDACATIAQVLSANYSIQVPPCGDLRQLSFRSYVPALAEQQWIPGRRNDPLWQGVVQSTLVQLQTDLRRCRFKSRRRQSANGAIRHIFLRVTPTTSSVSCSTSRRGISSQSAWIENGRVRQQCALNPRGRSRSSIGACSRPTRSTTASPLWTPISHAARAWPSKRTGTLVRPTPRGALLVPDMRSFDLNHIAIVATDVPPDATISDDSRSMRPHWIDPGLWSSSQ